MGTGVFIHVEETVVFELGRLGGGRFHLASNEEMHSFPSDRLCP